MLYARLVILVGYLFPQIEYRQKHGTIQCPHGSSAMKGSECPMEAVNDNI
jgi:hypothetical protein